jgi:hypothetical protein
MGHRQGRRKEPTGKEAAAGAVGNVGLVDEGEAGGQK